MRFYNGACVLTRGPRTNRETAEAAVACVSAAWSGRGCPNTYCRLPRVRRARSTPYTAPDAILAVGARGQGRSAGVGAAWRSRAPRRRRENLPIFAIRLNEVES